MDTTSRHTSTCVTLEYCGSELDLPFRSQFSTTYLLCFPDFLFLVQRKVSALLNGLSGPADVELCGGWEHSDGWGPCEELYGLISLPGSSLGPALITQATPTSKKNLRQILPFKICILGGKDLGLTAIFHVLLGCNCLGLVRPVIKTIEQCPQVTSAGETCF